MKVDIETSVFDFGVDVGVIISVVRDVVVVGPTGVCSSSGESTVTVEIIVISVFCDCNGAVTTVEKTVVELGPELVVSTVVKARLVCIKVIVLTVVTSLADGEL